MSDPFAGDAQYDSQYDDAADFHGTPGSPHLTRKPYLPPTHSEQTQSLFHVMPDQSDLMNQTERVNRSGSSHYGLSKRNPERTHEVTVFGFPPGKMHTVLNRLKSYGEYVKIESRGNWVDLRFINPADAEMCLGENGRTIDGEIKIGVVRRQKKPSDPPGHTSKPSDRTLNRKNDIQSLQAHNGSSARLFDLVCWFWSVVYPPALNQTGQANESKLVHGLDDDFPYHLRQSSNCCQKFMEYVFNW
mmetsp:Transcript_37472/g.73718  ORF Transcript_37472/g.73718 Transcript_37472/m.73718 type:complete len:245 (-) Transcript_37472:402-1136(-)